MGAGAQWFISLLIVLFIGGAVTAYLLKVRGPRDESAAGLTALAAMSWRDFINIVLGALTRRGYSRVFDEDATRDDSEYILEREGQRWLLACKHGSAFMLGPAAVRDMANVIRLNGLAGGLLLTQGSISQEARPLAKLQQVELLDGPTLWPELRDLIPAEQRQQIEATARQHVRKQVLLLWLVMALVAIVMAFTLPRGSSGQADASADTPSEASPPRVAAPDAVPAPATAPAPASAAQVPTPPDIAALPAAKAPAPLAAPAATATPRRPAAAAAIPVQEAESSDPVVLERQRAAVARAISTLATVDRAIWITQSTLQVYLLRVQGDAKKDICPLLERYPALASSRVQLTAPAESGAPVRFIQCRMY